MLFPQLYVRGTVLMLNAIKGQWVIDQIMGMKNAPWKFRLAASGWLVAILCAMSLFL